MIDKADAAMLGVIPELTTKEEVSAPNHSSVPLSCAEPLNPIPTYVSVSGPDPDAGKLITLALVMVSPVRVQPTFVRTTATRA